MEPILPHAAIEAQPHSVSAAEYRDGMAETSKKTVTENVLALLLHKTGPRKAWQSGVSRLMSLGVALGTAKRTLEGDASLGADVLDDLARKLGVQTWQLLVPGLDPAALPGLTEDRGDWPLPMVDREAYWALSETERAACGLFHICATFLPNTVDATCRVR